MADSQRIARVRRYFDVARARAYVRKDEDRYTRRALRLLRLVSKSGTPGKRSSDNHGAIGVTTMGDEHDLGEERRARAAGISDYLHDQAAQLIDAAEHLEDRAETTRAEADQMEGEAGQLRDRAERLHQQADGIDTAIQEQL